MQPSDIAIALRRRTPWEAMDLGLTMLQRWWRQVYLPHCLVAAPLMAAALALGWYFGRAWLAILIIWWLKPLYDRVVLHVLSRAVFGELPGGRQVLRQAGEWLGTGLAGALLVRWWPDLTRSFNLPVRQLEGQGGRAARERSGVLGRRVGAYAASLTLVCLAIEILVLWGSLDLLAQVLAPAKAGEGRPLAEIMFGASDEDAALFTLADAAAYALAVLLFEPFYVAAGFALYLNRRTLLEGWDIEVALRRIAVRHALLALMFGSSFFAADPGHAQDQEPREVIREVLSAKEFGYYRDTMRWEYRAKPDTPKDKESSDMSWLLGIGHAFARASEVLLWIVAGGLIAYALWWASRMLPQLRAPPREPYQPPAALFGMELAPETLPPDVGAAAAALAREGRLREALGLLYRGALSELVHKRGVQLLSSHTEGEAVLLARMPYFGVLVDAWRLCAYARRMPQAADVVRLADDYKAAFA